jgi:hypothetical protein
MSAEPDRTAQEADHWLALNSDVSESLLHIENELQAILLEESGSRPTAAGVCDRSSPTWFIDVFSHFDPPPFL